MSLRHKSRIIVFGALYSLDTKSKLEVNLEDSLKEIDDVLYLNSLSDKNIDREYVVRLMKNILDRRLVVDEIIIKAAPEWPLSKIHSIDRNILRMALSEMLFIKKEEVPMKVAINEAIDIAKEYGNNTSSKFINGVLGSVYKELLSAQDEEKQEEMKMEVKDKQLHIKNMLGIILYTHKDDQKYFGLIYDIFRHWGACKSESEKGEDLESEIIRIVNKEFGDMTKSNLINFETIGVTDFIAHDKDTKDKIKKVVNYYLVETDSFLPSRTEEKDGIRKSDWIRIDENLDTLRMYPDFVSILEKAKEKVAWNK